MILRILYTAVILALTSSGELYSQLPGSTREAIHDIFMEWNTPSHPGGTVGIMIDGKLVFEESYGLASLEFLSPNSNSTRYNIASVSKQFTAYAILLLESRGLLNVEDDVHKYLPELPDFGETITLAHMIHHTSGMRSLHTMLELAGWRSDDSRDNADLMRFMVRQRELNFKPGDQYMYCNTGYILLSEIIERVTGEEFPVWMEQNVFLPLGMTRTYVEERYDRVVTENAVSYYGSAAAGFSRAIEYWGYTGSGNIHSTASDMLTWARNFYAPPVELKAIFSKMCEREVLNNRDTIRYAGGVNVDSYYGHPSVSHGGSIGGYRSFLATYPEERISIAVLTNFSSSSPEMQALRVADILLGDIVKADSERREGDIPPPVAVRYRHSEKELLGIAGEYWSPELLTSYFISYRDGKLFAYHHRHGEFSLAENGRDMFRGSESFFRDAKVVRDRKGRVTGLRVSNSRVSNLWFEKR